jgi:hypothetical protein
MGLPRRRESDRHFENRSKSPAGGILMVPSKGKVCESGGQSARRLEASDSASKSQPSSLIFTGLPPCSALLSAAKMTSKDLRDSSKLVSGMGLPASRASKKAWNWLW